MRNLLVLVLSVVMTSLLACSATPAGTTRTSATDTPTLMPAYLATPQSAIANAQVTQAAASGVQAGLSNQATEIAVTRAAQDADLSAKATNIAIQQQAVGLEITRAFATEQAVSRANEATAAAATQASNNATATSVSANQMTAAAATQASNNATATSASATQVASTQVAAAIETATAWPQTATPLAATQAVITQNAQRDADRAFWDGVFAWFVPAFSVVFVLLVTGLSGWAFMRLTRVLTNRLAMLKDSKGDPVLTGDDFAMLLSRTLYPVIRRTETGGFIGEGGARDEALQDRVAARDQAATLTRQLPRQIATPRKAVPQLMAAATGVPSAPPVVALPAPEITVVDADEATVRPVLDDARKQLLEGGSRD